MAMKPKKTQETGRRGRGAGAVRDRVRDSGRSALSKNPRFSVSDMELLESMLPDESAISEFRTQMSGSAKKMRGGGMVKKMKAGGAVKKMRGGGMVKKMKYGGAAGKKGCAVRNA
jgi:hypothetical protein